MKSKLNYLLLLLMLTNITLFAQEEKAKVQFEKFAYQEAIQTYEMVIAKGKITEEILSNIANANYNIANYDEASKWFQQLIDFPNAKIKPGDYYRFSQALKSTEAYDKSAVWLKKFQEIKATDSRGLKYTNGKNYLSEIKAASGRAQITPLPINSSASEFAPSFYNDKLVFSSARDSGTFSKTIHAWNKKPFLNLFESTINENEELESPITFSKKLNSRAHESSTVFTKDGNTVYFTRNNAKNGAFTRDGVGVSRLKLYTATKVNNTWSKPRELPFNDDSYSIAHPSLNDTETMLYFASDMPGSIGDSDIFSVTLNTNNTYGTPVNLGPTVNTEGRETFPTIVNNSVLYFASDGHPGLGGLDIFAIDLNEDPGIVVNIGAPINSPNDDFSYIINTTTKKGYFASNRTGGQGSDDIYGFTETEALALKCTTTIRGKVVSALDNTAIAEASVKITNAQGKNISSQTTNTDGTFEVVQTCKEGTYNLAAAKSEFNPNTTSFTLKNKEAEFITLALSPLKIAASKGTELTKHLGIPPVYFDLDRAIIRNDAMITLDVIASYLKEFPSLEIEIGSHTDIRGSYTYNQSLSNKRAIATRDYLIAKGINSQRITSKGYGENQLVNDCTTVKKCAENEHQLNRRSEFIVIK